MSGAVERYHKEQERLRAEQEGSEDDVSITAPVEPEVNPKVYRDVEPLLYRGFLTLPAEINGVPFVFKSLNHHEFDLLRFFGSFERPTPEFWGMFLAYGVFVVGGVNVLPERERWTSKLADLFNGLPSDAMTRMIAYLSEVNRRASVATHLTEAYAMEVTSRYRWVQLKGLDPTSVAVTGIDGTQRLGLNIAQQVWRAVNSIEDLNEANERDWENTKFMGSCFAGKGMQKVYNQDARRRRQEREDRMTRKDKILRQWVLGEDIQDGVVTGPGYVMSVPRTVEELTTQLEKDIRGEKDWHDHVVEEHEARIRARHAEQRQQLEHARLESAQQTPEWGVFGGGSLDQTFSSAEVEERIRRRKVQDAARVQPDDEAAEKTSRVLDRWYSDDVTSQASTTNRDPSTAVQILPPRELAVPFRRK